MKKTKRLYQTAYELGAVVVRNDIEELCLMTIEAVQHTAFGESVRCIWFGTDDHLQFDQIPVLQLDLFPHPVGAPDIAVGEEVRVRSGGPVMTVLKLDAETGMATCEWDGPRGMMRRRPFPLACLSRSML